MVSGLKTKAVVIGGAGACATADEHPLVSDKGKIRGKSRKAVAISNTRGHNNHARVSSARAGAMSHEFLNVTSRSRASPCGPMGQESDDFSFAG